MSSLLYVVTYEARHRQCQTPWPTKMSRIERGEWSHTREHARSSVQATSPPVLGAPSALNKFDTIANFEIKVALGLRRKVV